MKILACRIRHLFTQGYHIVYMYVLQNGNEKLFIKLIR